LGKPITEQEKVKKIFAKYFESGRRQPKRKPERKVFGVK